MVEHLVWDQGATGSNPVTPTINLVNKEKVQTMENNKESSEKLSQITYLLSLLNIEDNGVMWKAEVVPSNVVDAISEAVADNMSNTLGFSIKLKSDGFPSAAIAILTVAGNAAHTLEKKNEVASFVPQLVSKLYMIRWIVAANNHIFGEVKPGKNYKRARLPSCLQTGISAVLATVVDSDIIEGRGDKSHPTWRDTIYTLKNRRVNWPLKSEYLDFLIKGEPKQDTIETA